MNGSESILSAIFIVCYISLFLLGVKTTWRMLEKIFLPVARISVVFGFLLLLVVFLGAMVYVAPIVG